MIEARSAADALVLNARKDGRMRVAMAEPNETYAYFSLHGDFDPAAITLKSGMEPSSSWRKGDETRSGHVRIFSRWSLESELPRSESLEAHISNVLKRLDGNSSAFKELSRAYSGTLQLVGYFRAEFPGLHFGTDMVAAIASYHLAIDFDFYGLYSHRREDTGYTFDPDWPP